ncbi:MAG: YqiJ family protein [Sphingopyxis sp.]|uniref:YqiJ family protein n=1 Tax=Sphingopyxis sp. TaxID=1908224 RepID=UPI003D80B0DD
MLDQFLAPENIVFSSALLLMLMIGAVQAIGLAGDIDADVHGDTDGDVGFADALLAWAGIGRVPFLTWLVLFLALFGALGLGLQQVMTALTGGPGTNLLMVPLTAVAVLPVTGGAARLVAHIIPGLETTAIDRDELIGLYAEISIGTASVGNPARARVTDPHGQPHQIMVEPDSADQIFQAGESVLLVKRDGDIFKAFTRGDFYLPRLD